MAQCTEVTPLALDNFRLVSSISTNFSIVNENTVGYSFYANHSQDRAMDVCWLENAKYYFYKKNA